tara:strand:+ start:3582 stop:3899 length:318 start_codon:yes stop_codon:yes gene_type:complete
MEHEIIQDIKDLIKLHDLQKIKSYYIDILNKKNELDIQNIYKQLILYACYNGSTEIIKFFLDLYYHFDDISKIALRQLFFYCKYILIRQKKDFKYFEQFLNKIRL